MVAASPRAVAKIIRGRTAGPAAARTVEITLRWGSRRAGPTVYGYGNNIPKPFCTSDYVLKSKSTQTRASRPRVGEF